MNKRTILIIATVLMVLPVTNELRGQEIQLHGFYGWQLNGTGKLYYGDFVMQDAANYGGKLSVAMSSTVHLEISYNRSDSYGIYYEYYPVYFQSERINYSSNYIQVGGLQEMDLERVRPFATVALGMVIWDSKHPQVDNRVQFTASLGAGAKIWLTDNIGLRLQGTMLLPMIFEGFGFGCGIGTGGSGCGANAYTRITPFQGEFSGGIVLRIPQ